MISNYMKRSTENDSCIQPRIHDKFYSRNQTKLTKSLSPFIFMNYSDSPIQFELTNNQLNDYFEKIISVHLNPFLNILCTQCPKKIS